MPVPNEVVLFTSQYVCVLLLVMQSINNNHGRTAMAMLTSVGIGVVQLLNFKLLPDATWTEMLAWLIAGPLGNASAQWVKRHDIAKIRSLPDH